MASLLLQRPERHTAEQVAYLEYLRHADVSIAIADALTQDFLRMVRERQGERLDAWIETAAGAEIAELRRFGRGDLPHGGCDRHRSARPPRPF